MAHPWSEASDPAIERQLRPLSARFPIPAVNWNKYQSLIGASDVVRATGRISGLVGLTIEADGPTARVGDLCMLEELQTRQKIPAEVVGFRRGHVLLMPIGDHHGIGPGWVVSATGESLTAPVSENLLGRVVDALANPIDGRGPVAGTIRRPLNCTPPHPLTRPRVTDRLTTGVRVIDTLLTLGKGQRMGLFAGSGVGKSTLMGMIARTSSADVNVIALVGERGKEVRDFLDRDLGPDGARKSVTVVCTSDQPALLRVKAALTATTIAEYFRDRGANVMLLVDSVTRWALAQREIGLATGEPPTTRGFPPSVFALLPRLLERAGRSSRGSITGVYTVLVEGDDLAEPISDSCRAILDGHLVLSRRIASQNHFPAVDVLESVSRVTSDVLNPGERVLAGDVRDILATYREAEDLIAVGAYKRGASSKIDRAIDLIDGLNSFLKQDIRETADEAGTWARLRALAQTPTQPQATATAA